MRWVGIAMVAAVAATWLGCGEEETAAPEVVRPIKILEIGGGSSAVRREYPGTIAAGQRAEMSFEVAGKLLELPHAEGDTVEAGTLLARLDDRDYRARLDRAQANANNARADYNRALKLFKEGVLAEAAKDTAKRNFEVTEADVREAQKAVDDTQLVAPFAGTVAKKLVQDFEQVQAKQGVVILENDTALEIEVDVPERDLLNDSRDLPRDELNRQLDPRVTLTARPDTPFPARVSELSTTADPSTRTFRATLTIDPPAGVRILPGMTAKVSVNRPEAELTAGLSIPARSVLADDSGSGFVWVVDPSAMTVSRRAVEVDAPSGDRIGIRSGLGDGDWVAISGVHQLREGMKVSRIAN